MKESSAASRSPLGYLAAFTLGIICMGAIFFFTKSVHLDQPSSGRESASSQPTEPSRSHFQRPPAGAIIAPLPSTARGTLRHLPTVRPTDPAEELAEASALEEPITEPEPLPIIVSQPVTVIADRPIIRGAGLSRENSRISGRTFLSGPAPREKVLSLDRRCAAEHPGPITTRFYVTGKDNSLADVLVVITAGLPRQQWPVPRRPVTLRLRGCIYENHIVGIQTDQALLVSNLDDMLHNIHITPKEGPGRNHALLPGRRPFEYKFSKPERFLRFKCDVHPWEFAYVNVIDHPFFAITDANGDFALKGLPPGDYTIQAHHRKAGILEKEITVEAHRNTAINFKFNAPSPQSLEI